MMQIVPGSLQCDALNDVFLRNGIKPIRLTDVTWRSALYICHFDLAYSVNGEIEILHLFVTCVDVHIWKKVEIKYIF